MKKQTGAASVTITPAIISQVEDVLAQAAKHKYQASKVYAAHNAVFGLNETPEVCASCNKKRGDALRKWYTEYKIKQIEDTNAQLNAEGQALTGSELPNIGNTEVDGANVSRETIGDLQAIYDRYVNRTQPQGEKEDIAQILDEHAADLSEEDALTLSDRLAELSVDADDEDAKGELADTIKPGVDNEAVNTDDDNEDAPLDLKNKKGEYFQGTFISEDGVNGQLVDLEGNSLKPGTYSTEMGDSYAVQPGGKATYKSDII